MNLSIVSFTDSATALLALLTKCTVEGCRSIHCLSSKQYKDIHLCTKTLGNSTEFLIFVYQHAKHAQLL